MVKGNTIFEDASDLHVRGIKVYAKSNADGFAYADKDCTVKVKTAELVNMFNMDVINVVDAGKFYKVVSMSVEDEVATVTYVKADNSTATTAVLATLKSE